MPGYSQAHQKCHQPIKVPPAEPRGAQGRTMEGQKPKQELVHLVWATPRRAINPVSRCESPEALQYLWETLRAQEGSKSQSPGPQETALPYFSLSLTEHQGSSSQTLGLTSKTSKISNWMWQNHTKVGHLYALWLNTALQATHHAFQGHQCTIYQPVTKRIFPKTSLQRQDRSNTGYFTRPCLPKGSWWHLTLPPTSWQAAGFLQFFWHSHSRNIPQAEISFIDLISQVPPF